MRKIAIIDGHPDPSHARLNHALAEHYAQAAQSAGHEVRRIDVARLDFPLLRIPDDFYTERPPQIIQDAQRDIAWADHLVFFYPLWHGDMPALLKAFIEQTFRPGFAMEYTGRMRFPKRLFTGKSARIVITMGMPAFIYRTVFGAYTLRSFKRMLGMCGVAPVNETLLGFIENANEATRRGWLDEMAELARSDGELQVRPYAQAARTLARTGMLLTAAYLLYAAATWSQYGKVKRSARGDALLDRAMPEYEVRAHHHVAVKAPAALTFNVIRETGLERSPIVNALFRAREVLLGAEHAEIELSGGLLEQLAAVGWAIVAEDPAREIVLGTATQPWQPSPTFLPLQSEEFARFREPGFAKIAFALRVDPLAPQTCEVHTETRVKTTDPVSRSRFRRYWAFLSPGIELIRIVLLQQVKTEAELRWKRQGTMAAR